MPEFQTQSSTPSKQLQIVQYTIDSIAGDTRPPEIIDDMLKEAWSEYMNHIIASKGPYSNEWAEAENIVKVLLWSFKPKIERVERACLSKQAFGLMTGLKKGLEFVDYGPYKTALFFKMLKEIHHEILETGFWQDKSQTNSQAVETKNTEKASNGELCEVLDFLPDTNKIETVDEIKESSGLDSGANEASFDIELPEKVADIETKDSKLPVHVEQAEIPSEISALKVGTWVEIRSEGSVCKCKISSKELEQQKFIFVNRHGVKISEKTFIDMDAGLGNGDVKILDDAFLFENALLSVIGNSRSYDKH